MRVTVLGVSATYPSPVSPASGYLLRHGETSLWVDAGSGTFAALQRHVSLQSLTALFLSHQHSDHCLDAIGLFYALRHGRVSRAPIAVYCPDAVTDTLARFVDDQDGAFADVATFCDPTGLGDVTLGALRLTFMEMNHPVPTLGLRAENNGTSFVYTADTGPSDRVVEFAAGADVLLAEATYQGESAEKPWPHHLTAREAGQLAREAGVGKLVLTHIWPEFDPDRSLWEAGEEFGGDVALAVPDATFDI